MTRLPLLFGFFLALSVSGVICLLSLVAKVKFSTMIFRALTSFFAFGIMGAALGSLFEVLVMPSATKVESERLKKEMQLENPNLEAELGDMLKVNKTMSETSEKEKSGKSELKPAVFPRMTVEGGKVVSRGDSAVVS